MTGDAERRLDALAALGDAARRRLLRYVLDAPAPVTRDEVAAGTGLSRSTAAYHLEKLAEAGLLGVRFERRTARRGPGAGRPAKLYLRPAEPVAVSVPPREYELLAGLLAEAVRADASGGAGRALREAARAAGARLVGAQGESEPAAESGAPHGRPEPVAGSGATPAAMGDGAAHAAGSGAGQVAGTGRESALAALAAAGFEPRREAGTIWLRNCPFERLARRHPELVCGATLALVEGAVQAAGAAGLRAALEPAPHRCCVVLQAA